MCIIRLSFKNESLDKMKAFVILLGITVMLLIGLTVLIVLLAQQMHRNNTKPSEPVGPGKTTSSTLPNRKKGKPTGLFFVYPESEGYALDELNDYNSLPTEKDIVENFNAIVSIGNSASKLVKPVDSSYKDRLEESFAYVEKRYPGMEVLRWMAYDFSTDSLFCKCNSKSNPEHCNESISTICKILKDTDCSATSSCDVGVAQNIQTDIDKYNLKGIMFDDEFPGSGSKIVPLFEKIKRDNQGLLLGWSGDIRTARKGPSGKTEYGSDTVIWDYCLGQVYTSNTLDLYGEGCSKFNPNEFWRNIKTMNLNGAGSVPVPMVCGAGDCQGDTNIDSKGFKCVDERLSERQIVSLIESRPTHNFAVWYGKHPQLKSGKATSGCDPDSSERCCSINGDSIEDCSQGCCNKWQLS